ncbi:MAG TPA: SlyX family protein [Spirochaetota bacterium]|nr:SlyX family protein [Spirochaetota bacterium]HRZ27621.1 SlyX family protein [Spirochaetota bacterium]HSA13505.1 SlyX family protein [Spirochaetota bacterium]
MKTEDRIITLETKIAYLENYIDELNRAILDQEKTIKRLILETEAIRKQIEDKKEALPENERPPHY